LTDDLNDSQPPYRWAALCFAVVMAIYYVTLAPTTAFWDTSEYIAAAKVLGIPHPPGNPLFTLMAHVWGLLPLAGEYAKRINLFAAFTSAAGAGLWFLVAERWIRPILPARGPRYAAAFAGVLAGATAWTVWNQSTVNEKVYTISLLSIAMVVWCAVRWADLPAGDRRDRWLIAAVYILALSSTNHQMGILAAPVLGIYVLATDWRVMLKPKVLMACAFVVVIGLSINYVYLPIRAGQYPPINEGEPAGFFSQALKDVLGRVQYAKPSVGDRQADLIGQYANYWQYWSWQWGRDLGALSGLATGLFSALTLGGLWSLIRRNLKAGLAAGALLGTLTVMLVFYLNFKYGFSYRAGDPSITLEMREVRERDYFFIASFAFAGVLIAAGFAAMIRGIGDWFGDRVPDANRYLMATPVLALVLVPLLGNRITASRDHETVARDFAIDILESIEPYGILITAGDNDTFPLWFAQEVLGVRRDVTLANLSLMNTDWHLRQIRRREPEDFNPATAASIWQPRTDDAGRPLGAAPEGGWVRPTTPVFAMSLEELDALPEISAVDHARGEGSFAFDSLVIQVGENYLTRSDIATILLIRDNLGKRPIYFSWSDGGYPDTMLGLTRYLISQGMVRKLSPTPVVADSNRIVFSQGMGWIDVERTHELLFGVYHYDAAARERPRGWVDPPSASILTLYELVYGGYADFLTQQGDTEAAARPDSIANAVARNIRR
jgi:hypothetical protein